MTTPTTKKLLLNLSAALLIFAEDGNRKRASVALAEAEQPCEDDALAAIAMLTANADAIATAYEALAVALDVQGGEIDPVGLGAPLKAASLRIEAKVAAMLTDGWARTMGGAYADLADAIDGDP